MNGISPSKFFQNGCSEHNSEQCVICFDGYKLVTKYKENAFILDQKGNIDRVMVDIKVCEKKQCPHGFEMNEENVCVNTEIERKLLLLEEKLKKSVFSDEYNEFKL